MSLTSETSLLSSETSDCDPQKSQKPRQSSWKPWRGQGWRINVKWGIVATIFALVVNASLLIGSIVSLRKPVSNGIVILFSGSCSKAKIISTTSHLFINVLSTLLLAASNVGMQCLMAPTRYDIQKAHARGAWLHIGVFSWSNMLFIPRRKVLTCIVLAFKFSAASPLVSLGKSLHLRIYLHFLSRYNSIISNNIASNDFNAFFVTEGFVNSPSWKQPPVLLRDPYLGYLSALQSDLKSLQLLSTRDCQKTYNQPFVSNFGNFLMMSKDVNQSETILFYPVERTLDARLDPNLTLDLTTEDSLTMRHRVANGWRDLGWLCQESDKKKANNGNPPECGDNGAA